MGRTKNSVNNNLIAFRNLLLELNKGAYSSQQLADKTGLRRLTVDEYLRGLHKYPNLVYKAVQKKNGSRGHITAYWSYGYLKEDAPRPPPQSRSEKNKRLRERNALTRSLNKGKGRKK